MNTKIVKWLMIVVFSILALTGCFVHHDRDDYYRDRDGRYYRDQGDWDRHVGGDRDDWHHRDWH
jgi:hypothetical protein